MGVRRDVMTVRRQQLDQRLAQNRLDREAALNTREGMLNTVRPAISYHVPAHAHLFLIPPTHQSAANTSLRTSLRSVQLSHRRASSYIG